jgi:hypothetical protein
MNLIQIIDTFKTEQDCIAHLEAIKWNNKPTCPYCNANNQVLCPVAIIVTGAILLFLLL